MNRSRRRAVVTALIALSAISASRAELDPTAWRQRQAVEIPAPGLIKLALPDATLDLARADHADLRLLGPSGQELAFALVQPARVPARSAAPRSYVVRQQSRSTIVEIETGASDPIDALAIAGPRGPVVKAARLEASADGAAWWPVAEGLQFTTGPAGSARLPLPHLVAAHLRLTLDDERTLPVPVTGATLVLAAREPETEPVPARLTRREEFAGETLLAVNLGAAHLPLTEIVIETDDPIFSRPVTITQRVVQRSNAIDQLLARGTIFRSADDPARRVENLRVAVDGITAAREIQVKITNGNSPPLHIRSVAVRRAPTCVVFQTAEAGRHWLLTGQPEAGAPAYDLGAVPTDFAALPRSPLTLGPAEPSPGYRRPDALAETALAGAPLDVSHWTFRRLVLHGPEAVQQVELDPVVLARAQPSLADLRLMRDGHQVPYLIERTALLRPVPLVPVPADLPAAPRVSRWTVALPVPGLPLQQLSVRSSTPLFSREVRVFELAIDARGETFERVLVWPTRWERAPGRASDTLLVQLQLRPETDQLIIEVTNGDNAPIQLAAVEGACATTRLLFRTDDGPLFLYYGEPGASAPEYDLRLAQEQMINAGPAEARLGQEERLQPGTGARAMAGRGGPLLWSALGAAVVVLLIVIGRLLPKPPTQD